MAFPINPLKIKKHKPSAIDIQPTNTHSHPDTDDNLTIADVTLAERWPKFEGNDWYVYEPQSGVILSSSLFTEWQTTTNRQMFEDRLKHSELGVCDIYCLR